MTTQVNLEQIWALSGGVTDPGDIKYSTGWIAEIPTFQNFNFVLQNHSKNILALDESGQFTHQLDINYKQGVRVVKNLVEYTCITDHINQDPELDALHSYWAFAKILGGSITDLQASHGLFIKEPYAKVLDQWDSNEETIQNTNAIIALNTSGAQDNWLFGNVKGELVAVNVGATLLPDGRNIDQLLGNSKRIFHEAHPPIQSEVSGTIPANPVDGKLYGRRDGNWVEVTTVKVQEFPPQPVSGNGSGWYNLQDGELYIDIDDGDSSQWVPSSLRNINTVGATGTFTAQSGEVVTVVDGLVTTII